MLDRLEGTIPVPHHDADPANHHLVEADIPLHEIRDAVPVEISDRQGVSPLSHIDVTGGLERAVSVTQKYANRRVHDVSDSYIGDTVAIEIRHCHGSGGNSNGKRAGGLEGTISVSQKNQQGAWRLKVRLIHGDEIEDTVAVEIRHRQATAGIGSDSKGTIPIAEQHSSGVGHDVLVTIAVEISNGQCRSTAPHGEVAAG